MLVHTSYQCYATVPLHSVGPPGLDATSASNLARLGVALNFSFRDEPFLTLVHNRHHSEGTGNVSELLIPITLEVTQDMILSSPQLEP